IADTFGPDKQFGMPGHQEIEIGLVKLFRVTGDGKYLNLAKYFLDVRGQQVDNAKYPQRRDIYLQSHIPVVEQDEAVGHSVRATYMYSGMADVAAIVGDKDYIQAIDKIWENVVYKKIYVTGGIGARHRGEAFGDDYELPNETAYNETCAAIANCMWNHRMFLLKGDAKYYDVLERTLYNGFLAGISIEGNTFFYPNPLACDAKYAFNQGALTRKPWFDCSCCPSNIVRFLPSLPGYIYGVRDNDLFINLYMSNEAEIKIKDMDVQIIQTSNYPWDGKIKVEVNPESNSSFNIKLRIPGWSRNQPIPGDLYSYFEKSNKKITAELNGKEIEVNIEQGYLTVSNKWKKGDMLILNLPMEIRLVESHKKVESNRNRLA
ncbi:MAG: glycoside hydrolase family 127 protein, partial [Cyclobacteriaceae bacterium]|nr:glycoside hydrolase family 127 protein [Cyclobacteriaceae bacterium]